MANYKKTSELRKGEFYFSDHGSYIGMYALPCMKNTPEDPSQLTAQLWEYFMYFLFYSWYKI